MGHQRLGLLPATRAWQDVVGLIADGAEAGRVARSIAIAIEADLGDRRVDPAVRSSFFLLSEIPQAARTDSFQEALGDIGFEIRGETTLAAVCAAFVNEVDRRVQRSGTTSDFGEMAALSAVEALHSATAKSIEDLFGWHGDEAAITKGALARLSTVKQFGSLAKDFFARLLRRLIDYYASRELPQHVGIEKRFRSLREHNEFDAALDRHCFEAAEIVRRFAGEWRSKAEFEGRLNERQAGAFVWQAFRKLVAELKMRSASVG